VGSRHEICAEFSASSMTTEFLGHLYPDHGSHSEVVANGKRRSAFPPHQSELIIEAAGTPVTLHFSNHLRIAGKSSHDWDFSKWSTTPTSDS
jgi:hypothetical protein